MIVETSEANDLLKKSSIIGLMSVTIALMIVVAYQQSQIHDLTDRATAHDEFIRFMQQGERFTLRDGKALYVIISDNKELSEKTKDTVFKIYKDEGSTQFSDWVAQQNVLNINK